MADPLIINSVTLRNFLSHRDTVVEFTRGVNVLIGRNGAGKTSILEAIYFALTGKGWRTEGRTKKSLVNERAREAEVILEFTYNGHHYRIHRFIGGKIPIIYMDNKPIAQGEVHVNSVIKEILGLPLDQLDKIVIIRQGGITRLFTQLRPSERKEAIDQLLGLFQYHEAGENLKNNIEFKPNTKTIAVSLRPTKTLESEIKKIANQIIQRYKEKMTDYLSLDKKLNEAKETLRELEEKAKELRPLAEKYDDIDNKYKKIKEQYDKLQGAMENLKKDLEELREKIKELNEKIQGINNEIEKYKPELVILSLEETIDKLGKLIDEKDKIEEKIKTLTDLLDEKKKLWNNIVDLRRKVIYGYSEIESKLAKIETDLKKLEKEKTKLEKDDGGIRDRLQYLNKEKNEINEKIIKIANLYEELFSEYIKEPSVLLKNIEKKYDELKKKYDSVQERLVEIEKITLVIKSRIEEVKGKIKLLESTEETVCPLCGQPLTEEHKKNIIERLHKEITENEKELHRLMKEKDKLTKEKKSIEEVLGKITETLISDLRESIKKLKNIDKEIIDLESKKKEITEKLTRLKEEITDLEKERKILEEMKSKAETLQELEQAFNEEEYKNLQLEIKNLKEKLEIIGNEINHLVKELEGKIRVEATSLEELYRKVMHLLENARRVKDKINEMRGELKSLHEQLQEYTKRYNEKEEQLNEIVKKKTMIEKKIKELENILREAKNARDELNRIEQDIKGLNTLIQTHDEQKKKLEKELEDIKKDVEELNKVYRKAAVLRWIIEKLFSRDGIPKFLRPRILRVLETYMEQYMNEFNLGFQDIEFDENYNIFFRPVEGPSVKRPLARLSGGEQVSMSMVALLALFHLISKSRIGFMALDEPTEYLDEERQKALVELLKKFQGGRILPQLIIVTHDESVKEAADRIYLVEKINGISKVTLVEPGGEI